jgi:hypothetical protein
LGPVEQTRDTAAQLFAVVDTIEATKLVANTAIRKYKTKLLSRVALRMLPARFNPGRRKSKYIYVGLLEFPIGNDARCSSRSGGV